MHTISKKHLAAITAACTLCCTAYLLGQLSVSALDTSNLVQTGTYNGFTYSITDKGATLTDYTGTSSSITIPLTIMTTTNDTAQTKVSVPVVSIDGVCQENTTITSVKFSEGFTQTGVSTFQGCTNLKTVQLPSTLKSIESTAFYHCSSLQTITIPDSVTTIADSAFSRCETLSAVKLSDSLQTIASYAFSDCYALKSVTLPNSLSSMGEAAFYRSGIQTLQLGTGLETIPKQAFSNCSDLKSISFAEGLRTIDEQAFSYCTALQKLVFPNSLQTIGANAFGSTEPNSIDYALRSIQFGTGLVEIGQRAFYQQNKLSGAIRFPEHLQQIGASAFYGCSNLTKVTFSNQLQTIGREAFFGCSSLRTVFLPDSITDLGDGAFSSCSSLSSARLPCSLEKVPDALFDSCGLNRIFLPDSITTIGASAFYGNENLTEVSHFSKNLKVIENDAFRCCVSLKEITLPEGLQEIGDSAFAGSGNGIEMTLRKVQLPSTLTKLGRVAFARNNSLTSITIPGGIKEIESAAFSQCTALHTLTLENGIETIGDHAFSYTQLQTIYLPDSVRTIQDFAFYMTSNTCSIHLGNQVTSIGESAFLQTNGHCNSIYIPKSVTKIGTYGVGYWTFLDYMDPVTNGFTIYGTAGSAAQTYADSNTISFVAGTEPELTKYYDAATGTTAYVPQAGLSFRVTVQHTGTPYTKGYTFMQYYQLEFKKDGVYYEPAYERVLLPVDATVRRYDVTLRKGSTVTSRIQEPKDGILELYTTASDIQLDGWCPVLGDVNDDGSVTLADAAMLQRYLQYDGTLLAPENADLNHDHTCNGFDLVFLKRTLLQNVE